MYVSLPSNKTVGGNFFFFGANFACKVCAFLLFFLGGTMAGEEGLGERGRGDGQCVELTLKPATLKVFFFHSSLTYVLATSCSSLK